MSDNLYWDIKKTISHNCLFNFIIGSRGVGKTYGSLKYCIEMYLKNKKRGKTWQFMYVRRLSTELEKLTRCRGGRLFNAVKNEFKDHTFKAESNVLYCDKEIIGYAQPLSTASILKSDAFPDVQVIIFDEFIIDNSGTYHYLKDEVRKFLDLYETVSRGRDVKVFFLSNAVSISNPYFDFFHLNRPYNGNFQKFGNAKEILVENAVNPNLTKMKQESRFGQIIEGSEYSEYAYENKWLLDNFDFIEKKTQRSCYYVTLKYKGEELGIWYDMEQMLFFVSNDIDTNFKNVFCVTTDDHKPNIMLLKVGIKEHASLRYIIQSYTYGAIRYESIQLKNKFKEIMQLVASY